MRRRKNVDRARPQDEPGKIQDGTDYLHFMDDVPNNRAGRRAQAKIEAKRKKFKIPVEGPWKPKT